MNPFLKKIQQSVAAKRIAAAIDKIEAKRNARPLIAKPSKRNAKAAGKAFRTHIASAFWDAGHAAWGQRAYGVPREFRQNARQ